jgi:uncharacterized membrane protein YbhN (UPF0104 family)
VRVRVSLAIFVSGFTMAITPAKLGEFFKCLMLKRDRGVRLATTAPIVVSERLTDLLAVLLLAAVGTLQYSAGRIVLVLGAGLTVTLFLLLALSPRFVQHLEPLLIRITTREGAVGGAHESARVFTVLLKPRPAIVGTVLGMAGWFCECLAFYLVFKGLGQAGVSLFSATFVYATATLAGAISFLPGGLGATEASMAALLALVDVARRTAAASTLIVRACTLWFAVGLGVLAYVAYSWAERRRRARAGAPFA